MVALMEPQAQVVNNNGILGSNNDNGSIKKDVNNDSGDKDGNSEYTYKDTTGKSNINEDRMNRNVYCPDLAEIKTEAD